MDHGSDVSFSRSTDAEFDPNSARRYQFTAFFDGSPAVNSRGLIVDPTPFFGEVITVSDSAVFIRTGRTEFAILDRKLLCRIPDCGQLVRITPHARRGSEDVRMDLPRAKQMSIAGGEVRTYEVFVVGSVSDSSTS